MCVQDGDQVDQQDMENVDNRRISWPLHCDLLHAQMDNKEKASSFGVSTAANSFPVSISFVPSCDEIFSFIFALFLILPILYYKLAFEDAFFIQVS